ncbi:Bug family tripartite tricarboxylate transporter substrate binding protein [Falsiroseomonas oryzae]|uniref:Bug family tripartite tricarboxylate transporter substrate binding protein n=1 Tax=Falsiroseomonas oryzae TaxID=2766473 RepID=UPI0022EA4F00|nr:tripartite tricarboxylate transporter substrate-binding protein [Roseomonas sp. MO-31]
MTPSRRGLVAAFGALPLLYVQARAQGWPARPVRFQVGYAAGGSITIAARLLGDTLGAGWGQSVVIENRVGAGGTIAAAAVARSEPDGYTLLVSAAGEIVGAPYTMANLPYDPQKDLTPISLIARNPLVLVVPASLPVRNLQELLDLAKRQPLSYASGGVGTATHFVAELFKLRSGANIEHVPYRGSGDLQADLQAGRVHMTFDAISVMLPQIEAGRVRAIGVTSATRSPQAPDIATLAELGVRDFAGGGWVGLLGPAALPAPLVEKLERDVRAAVQGGLGAQLAMRGFDPVGSSSTEFRRFIAEETTRWGEAARAAGMRPA